MRLHLNTARSPMETMPSSLLPKDSIDWAQVELPDAWPDELHLRRPLTLLGVLGRIFLGRPGRVALPEGLDRIVRTERIPKYVLQEFHNLPNGNYSKRLSRGYALWFDRMMLGTLREARTQVAQEIARTLAQAAQNAGTAALPDATALDIGCGAGHMAGALHAAGIARVRGLEPSPYLLQQAALRYPGVDHPGLDWLHGVAEDIPLPDATLDAVSICFVLHEVPPHYLRRILAELRRVMKPGAPLAIIEPSAVQWDNTFWRQWRQQGWRGVYFKLLALRVFEPFAEAWHRQDFHALLAEHGFLLRSDASGCPLRIIHAQRQAR